MKINLKKRIFNDKYYQYLNATNRIQILFGGSSGGKSIFKTQQTIYDILKGDRNYLVVRKVGNTIRKSVFSELSKYIKLYGLSKLFKINKSEMTITCINGYQIMFSGLDDVEKLKSITCQKGVITDVWIEEATEIKEEDLNQLRKRLRGKSRVNKRITLTFNPILKTHWIYKRFFGEFDMEKGILDKPDLLIIHSTYKDNLRFLEQDDVDDLENETNEYFYQVYTLGLWGIIGDLVYPNVEYQDLTDKIPHFDNIKNGLDFGFTNHPSALLQLHIDNKKKMIYIFNAKYFYGKTNKQLSKLIKDDLGGSYVFCDSAEPKSIQELKSEGINALPAKKGKDSIWHGIQWILNYKIVVNIGLHDLKDEFDQYQWAKDRVSGETLKVPVDIKNHLMDALRYSLSNDINIRYATAGNRI